MNPYDRLSRRDFLSRFWKWGMGLLAVAAAWTSWDVLRPKSTAGFGGVVETVPPGDVPDDGILYVAAARAYLTKVEGEVVAVSEACPHLNCRVPWCEQAGEFECPCHGSFFNRLGEYRKGPSPRGMDRFAVEIIDDKVIIDTGSLIEGDPPGGESIDEPATGAPCMDEEG
ncbi:MAG: ubiquinol-cytochrome c reductase iron-sulfur subunit [Acidimicrobiia bacterium]|nr:ubiquinol-cytochrome c reductase iron-sulfur subunit [Acidimicrobiia bacterium]